MGFQVLGSSLKFRLDRIYEQCLVLVASVLRAHPQQLQRWHVVLRCPRKNLSASQCFGTESNGKTTQVKRAALWCMLIILLVTIVVIFYFLVLKNDKK